MASERTGQSGHPRWEIGLTGSASPLAIGGAALYWLWMDQAVFTDILAGAVPYRTAFILTTLCSVVLLPLLLRLFRSDAMFEKSRLRVALAWGVVGALGGAAQLVGGILGSPAMGVIGALLNAVFFAYGNLLWGWVCVVQGHVKAVVHIAAAWAVSLPFNLMFSALPRSGAGITICMLPLLSAALFCVLEKAQCHPRAHIEPAPPAHVDVLKPDSTVFGVDGRLLALISAFCCVFGLMYFQQMNSEAIAGVGTQVVNVRGATALVFLIASLTLFKDRVSVLFKACFYALVAGIAVMVVGIFVPTLGRTSEAIVAVGYCGFDILVWTMIAYHGYVSPNRPVKTVCVAMTCEQAAILLGVLLGMLLETMELASDVKSLVMMCVVLAALAVLVTYTEYGSRMWGLLVDTSLSKELPRQSDDKLTFLRNKFGLTQRELDITALFLQGRSMAYIAEKSFVSENTVKTHVQHVYRKCGVHNKQELIDLAQQEGAASETSAR